jgi:uncharacterized membrane protein YeaQ/YmgE (transglycosylase-associated protein family)
VPLEKVLLEKCPYSSFTKTKPITTCLVKREAFHGFSLDQTGVAYAVETPGHGRLVMTLFAVIFWILTGIGWGWFSNTWMQTNRGLWLDIPLGITGACVGGLFYCVLDLTKFFEFNAWNLFTAWVGAVFITLILRLFVRPKSLPEVSPT